MKKLLSVLLVGAMVASFAACGGAPASSGAAPAESSGAAASSSGAAATDAATGNSPDNDMVLGMQADATHLDPHVSGNGISNMVTNTMYECLITFDEKAEIIPGLAKSWTISDDALTYTFELQEGVKFHDGEPFNADAVIANYQRAMDDQSLRLYAQVSNWESITAEGDYKLVIKLKKANNTTINKLTQVRIVSPKAIKELGKDGLAKASAGTGPYIFSERVEGGYTKVVRNENYWGQGPKIDSLTFQVVPEDGARIAMLKTGEADVIHPVPPIQVPQIENDPTIQVNNFEGITYRYATLNKNYTLADGKKPLDDVRVRQAMNYAFDSEAYAKVVFQGYMLEPTSIFASSIMYHAPQTPYKKDIEKAKSLMKEAGFEAGFPIDIWVDNTTIEMQGAEFLKQQLADINITVNVKPMESTTIAEMTSVEESKNEVQMWYVNWGSGSYEADGSMRNILHGDKFPPTGYNTAFWNNAEFNKLLDDALLLSDTTEIAKLYAEAQAIAWNECPWIFLGNDNTLNAQRSYVKGVKYKPGGDILFDTAELIR